MIIFLQKSKFNKNSFLEVERTKATHFKENNGMIHPIKDLRIMNQSDEEPLELPSMGFVGEIDKSDGPLVMPSVL